MRPLERRPAVLAERPEGEGMLGWCSPMTTLLRDWWASSPMCSRKLTTLIRASEQERALRDAATVVIQRTADELRPGDGEEAEHIALVVSQISASQRRPCSWLGMRLYWKLFRQESPVNARPRRHRHLPRDRG